MLHIYNGWIILLQVGLRTEMDGVQCKRKEV